MVRIKHPEFHTYRGCRPCVREPYAKFIPLENITLEINQDASEDSIKVETQDSRAINFEDPVKGDCNDIL